VGIRKTFQKRSGVCPPGVAVEASTVLGGIETEGPQKLLGIEPGGCPVFWPGGVRRRGGVILVCGSGTEREKASVDMASGVAGPKGRERERAEAETKGIEY
jgi:hypothetical protein